MSNLLIESCLRNQGVGQCAAYVMCSNCTDIELNSSRLLSKFAGCIYSSTISKKLDIHQMCCPTCKGAMKSRDFDTGDIRKCDRKVCFSQKNELFCTGDKDECVLIDMNDCSETCDYSMFFGIFFIIMIVIIILVVINGKDSDKELYPDKNEFK